MRFFDAVRSKQPTMKRVGGNSCPERIAQEMKGKKKKNCDRKKKCCERGEEHQNVRSLLVGSHQ